MQDDREHDHDQSKVDQFHCQVPRKPVDDRKHETVDGADAAHTEPADEELQAQRRAGAEQAEKVIRKWAFTIDKAPYMDDLSQQTPHD